jgi:hypothetical protein
MARTNGGITGKKNTASFGKCTVTSKTSTGTVTTQPGTKLLDYLVVAGGGGGGGGSEGGGGGAGGYRSSGFGPATLRGATLSVCGNSPYPITVGGGGASKTLTGPTGGAYEPGGAGSNSSLVTNTTITSTGGGGGGGGSPDVPGTVAPGGSGGSGGGKNAAGGCVGAGNTPPVDPSQGNAGGVGAGTITRRWWRRSDCCWNSRFIVWWRSWRSRCSK